MKKQWFCPELNKSISTRTVYAYIEQAFAVICIVLKRLKSISFKKWGILAKNGFKILSFKYAFLIYAINNDT